MHYPLLSINQLELFVHIGCTAEEKSKAQQLLADIHFFLPKDYPACESDNLQDTFCYEELIQAIKLYLQDKQYQLIEKFSKDLFIFIKNNISPSIKVSIRITKFPPIAGLKGGVGFCLGEQS